MNNITIVCPCCNQKIQLDISESGEVVVNFITDENSKSTFNNIELGELRK